VIPAGASAWTTDRQRLADLQTLLSQCFQHPDADFVEAVQTGQLEATFEERLGSFETDLEPRPPDAPEGFREAYMRTFEGYDGGYAPPVESVYEEWWDGTERELLSGPAARDMRRRYAGHEIETPSAYPADHVSLLLEYGSLLLEAGAVEEYLVFHDEHFDWIPAFRERVAATCDVPFYSWAVETLEAVLELSRTELQSHDLS
jgi:TorA maturation chaperone TorD